MASGKPGRRPPVLGDQGAYAAAWSALDFADRRRITKAVNRGNALDDGREAELAVMTARRQATFWRWGWLIGPAATLLQWNTDLPVFLASILVSGLVTGTLSWIFLRRTRRAIDANIELAEQSAERARRKQRKQGKGSRPHPKSQEALASEVSEAAGRGLLRRRRQS